MLGIFSAQGAVTNNISKDMKSIRTELGELRANYLVNRKSSSDKQLLLDRIVGALGNAGGQNSNSAHVPVPLLTTSGSDTLTSLPKGTADNESGNTSNKPGTVQAVAPLAMVKQVPETPLQPTVVDTIAESETPTGDAVTATTSDALSDNFRKEDTLSLGTLSADGEAITVDESLVAELYGIGLKNTRTSKPALREVVTSTEKSLATDSDIDGISMDDSLAEEMRGLFNGTDVEP